MSIKAIMSGAAHLLVKRYAGPFWIRRRWLKKTQWLSCQQLQEIQLKLFRSLVRHCYNSVPFYRRMMNERGISAEGIRTLEDIKQFPIINKRDVLEAGDSIVSTRYPKWALHKARTGGSTGTPLVIYRNIFSLGSEHAFVRRQWDWAGIGFREKCAYIFQRVVAPPDKKSARLYDYDPIMKELTLSAYHCSADTAIDYAKLIKDYGIKVVVGYPSAVYLIAKTCIESGFTLDLRVVMSTWEAMTEPMRNTITEAFGCKVYDFYGSGERVVAIHKCERESYHIIPEYGFTELIPMDGYEKGYYKIVSTGFWNKAMPLIRYEMGDVVAKGDDYCPCGREFAIVKSIIGKEGDVIRTPSGIHLGVTAVLQLLYIIGGAEASNVLETQFVQDTLDHVIIEYVPGAKFSKDDLANMKDSASRCFPGDLKFDFKQVKRVRRTPMGKIRPIISHISE